MFFCNSDSARHVEVEDPSPHFHYGLFNNTLAVERILVYAKITSSWITHMLEPYVEFKLERKNSAYFTCMESLLI